MVFKFNVKDCVYHTVYGKGDIVERPLKNTTIYWVHFDNDGPGTTRCINEKDLCSSMFGTLNIPKVGLDKKDNRLLGEGGAPTRTTSLPENPLDRKNYPIASGVLDYFPDAIVAISQVSKAGNDQHNPGLPLRWTRSKSGDEADTCMRHFLQRGTKDVDGQRHTAKAAWRILALLQKEIESESRE